VPACASDQAISVEIERGGLGRPFFFLAKDNDQAFVTGISSTGP
jgi:hypothetical protein